MRTYLALFIIILGFQCNGQDLFTISLDKFTISGSTLKVSEVIDARQDQRVVGVIQRGIADRKDLAVFARPGLKEVEELLKRSGIFTENKGIAIRISKLAIFEVTSIWRETAKAEISVDFFVNLDENYYYITSVYTSVEPKAMDVTRFHPANIAAVIESALALFQPHKNEIESDYAFTRSELMNPMLSLREIYGMPIINAARYKDGYYASYEEFVKNEPSISLDCQVKPGNTTVVKCGGNEAAVNIYGYAKGNELYILFHHDFYHLKKDAEGFAFRGPKEISNKDVSNYYKSMVAARHVGGKRGHYTTYRIDLNTGSIDNTAGL
jgi:hypothetical protein